MRPVLVEIGAALTIKEAASPRQLLVPGGGPERVRQTCSQRPGELRVFHAADPGSYELSKPRDVRARRGMPVVEGLPSLPYLRALDAAHTNGTLELQQHLGNIIGTRLIDPRLNTAPSPVRPSLPLEEPGGPRQLVSFHPRELDTNSRACMSSERAFGVLISCGACRHFLQSTCRQEPREASERWRRSGCARGDRVEPELKQMEAVVV